MQFHIKKSICEENVMDYLTDEHYQIATKNGISRQNAYQRVYEYGWEIKKAIETPVRQCGNLYPKYREQCERIGLGARGFYHRLERGMTPEQAATTPIQNTNENIKHTPNYQKQRITKEQETVALSHGISRKTAVGRIIRGWSVDEAITLPLGTYRKGRNKQDETWAYAHFKSKQ